MRPTLNLRIQFLFFFHPLVLHRNFRSFLCRTPSSGWIRNKILQATDIWETFLFSLLSRISSRLLNGGKTFEKAAAETNLEEQVETLSLSFWVILNLLNWYLSMTDCFISWTVLKNKWHNSPLIIFTGCKTLGGELEGLPRWIADWWLFH